MISLPEAGTDRAARWFTVAYGLFGVLVAAGLWYALRLVIQNDSAYVLPICAALVALPTAAVIGTRIALPIYFCTTFGGELTAPGIPISINRVAALLLLAALFFDALRHPWRLRFSVALLAFGLFHLYFLTAMLALRPEGAPIFSQPILYFLILVAVAANYWREDWMRVMLWSFLGISTLFSLVGYFEMATLTDVKVTGIEQIGARMRANGLSKDAIQFAFIALWAMLIGLYLFVTEKNPLLRLVAGASVPLLVGAMALTFNRQTPFIAIAAAGVMLYLCRSPWRAPTIAFAVIVGIAASPFVGARIVDRLVDVGGQRWDPSLAVRYDKALIGWHMIQQHPWFGIGHSNFIYTWRDYRPIGDTVYLQDTWETYHPMDLGYWQIVVEYGIIGSALFVVTMGAFVWLLWRMRRIARRLGDEDLLNMQALFAGLMTQLLVSLLIQDTLGIPRTYLFLGFLLAGFELARLRLERAESAPPEGTATTPGAASA